MISQPLAEVRQLYAEAELAIKRYERIALEDQIAAINELRYAGHHILEAENEEDEAKRQDHVTSARNHCLRAVQDAKDGAIVAQLEYFAQFFDCRFAKTELEKCLPDWKALFAEIASIQKMFANAGRSRDIAYGDEVDAGILRLLEIRERFVALQPVLDENRFVEEQARKAAEKANADALRQQEQDEKDAARLTEHRHFVISIVVAVALSILGIVVSILI